jgi:hypothetical protein
MRAVLLTLLLALVAFPAAPAAAATVTLPPTGTDWDYQLGGTRPVPDHVGIVERDRRATPHAGTYDICYVNGFQTQADEKAFWHRHWSLVLKRDGKPVVDLVWGSGCSTSAPVPSGPRSRPSSAAGPTAALGTATPRSSTTTSTPSAAATA